MKVPGTQGYSGSKGNKLGVRGASWKQGQQAGGFLRPQGSSRDPGMLRSEGSELGVRKESWGLPSFLAPTEMVGTLKHSITFGLLPSLQLTPACSSLLPSLQLAPVCSSLLQLAPANSPHSSSLQFAPACFSLLPAHSPHCQLAPLTPACFSLLPLLPACSRDPGML